MPSSRPSFTVLLVEDELADALMFQEMLEEVSPDISFHHVVNGQDALRFLERADGYAAVPVPHLIVLDLNMPVMNGHDFLQRAKSIDGLRRIPVLVLSTSNDPDDIHRSYDGQASGYVVKPSTYAEYARIMSTIEAYWRGVVRLPTVADLSVRS
ncbi:response regulator [Deinococcus sp. Arct2-2]|uniref:response regulator n=1 Tax=Deinococcus sp. Arct2-2 TaxID=2568653 RepID=UPI0010A3B5BD|nr:response regulator [Deinococcus sp. Arct2-2]THF71545.1 response regulator [Deinococcus sp. Arct2-2]